MFKKNFSWDILVIFLLLLCSDTLSQVLFKYASVDLGPAPLSDLSQYLRFVFILSRRPSIVFGVLLLLVSFFCWMALISRIDLSKAHLVSCIAYATVPAISILLFKESVNHIQMVGIVSIVAGALIASNG
jgi:multidrug transporter EmrE-like cation transporter